MEAAATKHGKYIYIWIHLTMVATLEAHFDPPFAKRLECPLQDVKPGQNDTETKWSPHNKIPLSVVSTKSMGMQGITFGADKTAEAAGRRS